jgi:molybdate transport system substrate-binding protein
MTKHGRLLFSALAFICTWGASSAQADTVQVAVAANFAEPFQKIAAAFLADTGHSAVPIVGSTGKFYAQIKFGAPFDVLLAADDETPRKLEDEGLAVKGQRFTYAIGKLALWSAQPNFVDAQGAVLKKGLFEHLALANPKLAPYGAAGVETLKALGLYEALSSKIVQGESIAQAHQFVSTGNADAGLCRLVSNYQARQTCRRVLVAGAKPVLHPHLARCRLDQQRGQQPGSNSVDEVPQRGQGQSRDQGLRL